jgi:hypothetical protein
MAAVPAAAITAPAPIFVSFRIADFLSPIFADAMPSTEDEDSFTNIFIAAYL